MGSFLFSIVYQRPKNVSAPDFHIPKAPFMIVPLGFSEGDGQLFFFGIGLKRQIDPGIMRICRAAGKIQRRQLFFVFFELCPNVIRRSQRVFRP